ncbi:MAG: hypothetical protein IJS55_03250 [Oscillospiraceae bacterium]|nr:hypothetical protein [Oscillospiraceae bacterium]
MTAKEYIEREAALDIVTEWCPDDDGSVGKTGDLRDMLDELEAIPAADVVEVVRCRECTLHDSCYTEDVFKFARLNDDRRFCSFGESHRRGE